jgi:hypothetical protein
MKHVNRWVASLAKEKEQVGTPRRREVTTSDGSSISCKAHPDKSTKPQPLALVNPVDSLLHMQPRTGYDTRGPIEEHEGLVTLQVIVFGILSMAIMELLSLLPS